MKRSLRLRFYPEAILGVISGILFVVTLINHAWIEIAFNVDPDQGSGMLEWLVVGGLLVATVALFSLAGYEWRRTMAVAG